MAAPTPEPMLMVLAPRRGRPRAEVQRTSVTAWIPVETYDRLTRIAQRKDMSISSLIDYVLRKEVKIQKPRA